MATTQSWAHINEYYNQLATQHHLPVSGIQRLLVWIKKMNLEANLYAFTSMHDLVISDQENPDQKDHRLAIECVFGKKKVRFVYSRQPGSTEQMIKEVEEDLAQETLREFLAYKFGIYRAPEKPTD